MEAKNAADALIYSTEKSLNEMGGNVDGGVRMEIDDAISNLKNALKGEDAAQIRQLTEVLTLVRPTSWPSPCISSRQVPSRGQAAGNNARTGAGQASANEDVVDAEYEEVA